MQPRTKILLIALGYVATVLAFFFLDNFPELAKGNRYLRGFNTASLLYRKAVTSGFRKPRNNYVVLILLDDKVSEDIKNNYCLQRRYLASVISKIRDTRPAIIALDLLFGQGTCPETTDVYHGTAQLQAAIADVSKTIPVVIAQKTIDASFLEQSPEKLASLRALGFKDTEVIVEPSDRFDSADTKVSYGLYTFNEDSRKIPLSWSAYSSSASVGNEKPSMLDTFSVAVAKAYLPDPRVLGEIRKFQAGRGPLTSFLTEPEIRCFSSADILNTPKPYKGSEKCRSTYTDTDILAQLEHRIVVIGKDVPDIDRHDSIMGVVSGAVLQANYIESILDSRFLRPVQGWLSLSVALVWLGLIELIFRMSVGHPHRALGLAILATVIVWIVLYDFVLMQWGYYLVLWPPSIIAILWRYVLVWSESATQHPHPQIAPLKPEAQPEQATQKEEAVK